MIVLVGFMGSGKTTVARVLAARLGLPYADTDRIVEEAAGAPIGEIFRRGEEHFRAHERAAVELALAAGDGVVSLGGGAVVDTETRARLRDHTVVWLDVTLERALERAAGDETVRPLLDNADPAALYEERKQIYGEVASVTVATDDRSPSAVVDEIVTALDLGGPGGWPRRVRVALGDHGYEVVVGRGVAADLARYWDAPPGAEKGFVISHPVLAEHAQPVADSLKRAGLTASLLWVREGEGSKGLDTAARLYAELANLGAHRDDVIVSVGGGVIGDLGGFVASTYMRGVAHVAVPTTLLAQVDAAIGGKTGVNVGDVKNLVGTIEQPRAVLCDVELLATCPVAETRSGLAEVVKYGFIADPAILDVVMTRSAAIVALDEELIEDLVARSVAVKASIVASDERERSDRAFLNYGHTFAHAIESVVGLGRIRHGEAVALGMLAAAYASEALGWISAADVELHRAVVAAIGLPTRIELDYEAVKKAWTKDKKYRAGARFVLLRGLGRPVAGVEVPEAVLQAAVARLARED